MKYDVLQGIGAVMLCLGAQGVLRLLFDHDHIGLLRPVTDGFSVAIALYAAALFLGATLAGWAHDQAKALGRRSSSDSGAK
ncbi:MAG: hypothetical protein HOV68_17675 [Streptomycetaceae bacterium]|nr:hypothetical protein [Streptomycetaceae bacterium]